jgi:hypothetical protein
LSGECKDIVVPSNETIAEEEEEVVLTLAEKDILRF